MKAKLLKKVRSKVSLQERNGNYYVFVRGNLKYTNINILVAKALYRAVVIDMAIDMSNYKCKKRIL